MRARECPLCGAHHGEGTPHDVATFLTDACAGVIAKLNMQRYNTMTDAAVRSLQATLLLEKYAKMMSDNAREVLARRVGPENVIEYLKGKGGHKHGNHPE
jgi:hypothetical protein